MLRCRSFERPRRPLALGLTRDEGGAVAVFVAVALAMFFALGALVADAGRLYNLHSQLQAYADHVALAAAAELDGQQGAIARATQAATGPGPGPLVTDTANFLNTAELQVSQLRFLRALPDDTQPIDFSLYETTDDALAAFAYVAVEPEAMNFMLLPVLRAFGIAEARATARASADAVAGFTRQVCNFPPLMICNPYENPNAPYGGDFTPIIGQQILVKGKGPNTQWMPGDFGLLQAAENAGAPHCTGGGANRIRCVMGLVQPNTQCVDALVDIMPGQAVSVHTGLNVRFDIWDPPLNNRRTNPNFAPSVNVTKGKTHGPNQCTSNQLQDVPPAPNDTVTLPRDQCFATGTCDGGRFGDGVWDAVAYWDTNHPFAPPPAGLLSMTRYDVYRYEVDNDLIPNKSASGGENGNPTCAPAGINNPARDRRVLTVAVINCREHGIQGRTDDVPVIAFGQMFMTEPVGDDDEIWVEMLGVAEPGGADGVLHEFPQLYR